MRRFTKALSILLSALMVLSLMPALPVKASETLPIASWQDEGVPNTEWYTAQTNEGKGGSDNPYVIATAEQLAGLAQLTNEGTKFVDKYIRLDNDIDLGGRKWVSIGINDKYFIGNFDGNNHIVKNLTQYASSDSNAGLFGNISINWGSYKPDAFSVKNLGIVDVNISGTIRYGGALASSIDVDGNNTNAACENCFSTGYIHSDFWMGTLGGLFGYINLSNGSSTPMIIKNCYSECDISLTSSEYEGYDRYAGGLIGKIEHFGPNNLILDINNCYSASRLASALAGDSSHMGGFAGTVNINADAANQIIINNCMFDVQAAGISYGFDKAGKSYDGVQGKTTSQMTGMGALSGAWDASVWQAGTDLYPQLRMFASGASPMVSSSSLAGAIPIFLFENQTIPELSDTSAKVRNDFRVPIIDGVTWTTGSPDIITIDGSGNAVLKRPSNDTYVTLTAQLGNNVKKDFVILCKAGADASDTTPPVITFKDIIPKDFSSSVTAASNEGAEIYILVNNASEAAPTAAQIICDNKTKKGSGTEFTTVVSSLNHSTDYIAYAIGVDSNGNVSDVSSKPFTTLSDSTPPASESISGYISIFGNEASFSADYNEAGTIKYVVLKSDAKEPTKEQIVSGLDGDGKTAVYYNNNVQYIPKLTKQIKFDVSNLIDDVYNIFLFCEDEHGNSADIQKLSFTTKDDDILQFNVEDQIGISYIDSKAHTVVFHMPSNTDGYLLKPSIMLSDNASVFPKSGDAINFANPQNYTVTANYGTSQMTQRVWKVTCIPDITLKSIQITKPANKLTYTVGEELDITGIEVVGTYSDNSKKILEITKQNVSGFDSSASAEGQILTVTAGGKTAAYTVTIKEKVPVSGVSLDKMNLGLKAGGISKTLTATVNPINATNKKVTWSSSNPKVAVVDENGKVTPKAAGMAIITVKTEDGDYKADCLVDVIVPVSGVTLDKSHLELKAGGIPVTLTATVNPTDATNKNVSWLSFDPKVAAVENGKVTPKAAGTTTIIVQTQDGIYTATCTVKVTSESVPVTIPVSGVSLDKPQLQLIAGGIPETLTATVNPIDATNKKVTWSSSDSKVATVENGIVTPKAAGTATITVRTEDGGCAAACQVIIIPKLVPTPKPDPDPVIPAPTPTPIPPTMPEDVVTTTETIVDKKTGTTTQIIKTIKIDNKGNAVEEVNSVVKDKNGRLIEKDKTVNKQNKVTGEIISIQTKTQFKEDGTALTTSTSVSVTAFAKEIKATDEKTRIMIAVPSEDIAKAAETAAKDKPLEVSVKLPNNAIQEQIKSRQTASIEIEVIIPSEISSNDKINLNNITLDKNIIETAKTEGKDVTISVKDEKGKELYRWFFSGKQHKISDVPVVEYVNAPVLEYKAGDIVRFDLHAPNYNGRVQYRVVLWDGNKKEARDLWTTSDRYYNNWIPNGNDVFNLHWKIDKPGVYRITVYVKRAGISNSKTALNQYNCDSYMESQEVTAS